MWTCYTLNKIVATPMILCLPRVYSTINPVRIKTTRDLESNNKNKHPCQYVCEDSWTAQGLDQSGLDESPKETGVLGCSETSSLARGIRPSESTRRAHCPAAKDDRRQDEKSNQIGGAATTTLIGCAWGPCVCAIVACGSPLTLPYPSSDANDILHPNALLLQVGRCRSSA